LKQELTIIRELRPAGLDVILIDDLRIYEDGPFAAGNLPPSHPAFPRQGRDLGVVAALFGTSHTISRHYDDEGYLILLPMARPQSPAVGAAVAMAMRKGQDGRAADAGRILRQVFDIHGAKPQTFMAIATCLDSAFSRGLVLEARLPEWADLAGRVAADGHAAVAIAGTGYDACLALVAARRTGLQVACLVGDAPARSGYLMGGPEVLAPEAAARLGATALVLTIPEASKERYSGLFRAIFGYSKKVVSP
jgi:hypothetical protein